MNRTTECCIIVSCMYSELFGMDAVAKDIRRSDINAFLGLNTLVSAKLKRIKNIGLYDIVSKIEYGDVLSSVQKYFDSNAHQFNENWAAMLVCLQNDYCISSLMEDGVANSHQIIKEFYTWCEVTAELICNYDIYSMNEGYVKETAEILRTAVSKIRGDKSRLLDDFIEILLDPSAMFAPNVPVKTLRWQTSDQ